MLFKLYVQNRNVYARAKALAHAPINCVLGAAASKQVSISYGHNFIDFEMRLIWFFQACFRLFSVHIDELLRSRPLVLSLSPSLCLCVWGSKNHDLGLCATHTRAHDILNMIRNRREPCKYRLNTVIVPDICKLTLFNGNENGKKPIHCFDL